MDLHCRSIVIALTLCGVLQPSVLCDYVKARRTYKGTEYLNCSFKVQPGDSPCNSTLRQVFRILDVTDDSTMVTIGSTECVYTLDENLTLQRAASIPLDSAGDTTCRYLTRDSLEDFMCKNYILYGYRNDDTGSLRVCGTFSFSSPMCWECTDNGNALNCTNGVKTAYMPTTPTQNFTIARATATAGGQEYFFIGGLKMESSDVPIFAKVLVSDAAVTSAVTTDSSKDQIMYKPLDFVGEPVKHGEFIYFFFRERAKEYDNIGNIIYSRVARVCKNDIGGVTNPLDEKFTTFLKTRLNCSVGTEFPFQFNEIQDVKQSRRSDQSIVYGLFTTPNAGTSSSAICRYDLNELDMLFNTDLRRGQTASTQAWQKIDRHDEDQFNRRNCSVPYDHSNGNIYNDLQSYPLMNTNAPNCGLSTSCSNFERNSDNALAVFENVRGQKLAIRSENASEVTAFIGTNDRTILQTHITSSGADIIQKIEVSLESIPEFSGDEIRDKWPYGVSYLQLHNGKVYGTLDNCAFQFTPITPDSLSQEIIDRTKQMDYNHSVRIEGAVTTVFKLFEAPEGTQMQAKFSGLFTEDTCTQKRFSLDSSCREFLHVVCSIRDISPGVSSNVSTISVSSLSGSAQQLSVSVTINFDDTDPADVDMNDIRKYDADIAEYTYKYRKWLRDDVDCQGGVKGTCPGPSDCCGNC